MLQFQRFLNNRLAANSDGGPRPKQLLMPVVDNVTESLMGQTQRLRRARNTTVSLIKRGLDQLALPLMYFLLKRAFHRRSLGRGRRPICGN